MPVRDHSRDIARMSNPPAIEIAHLSHRYGEHEAIRDLSLSIAAGEIFALLGPQRQRQDDALSRALDA